MEKFFHNGGCMDTIKMICFLGNASQVTLGFLGNNGEWDPFGKWKPRN